jgi:Ribosomal protein L36e
MVKSGYAKGANSGHITQERTLKPKPARRKGVRTTTRIVTNIIVDECIVTPIFRRNEFVLYMYFYSKHFRTCIHWTNCTVKSKRRLCRKSHRFEGLFCPVWFLHFYHLLTIFFAFSFTPYFLRLSLIMNTVHPNTNT